MLKEGERSWSLWPRSNKRRLIVAHTQYTGIADLVLEKDRLTKLCQRTGYITGDDVPPRSVE